jgi:hypothetical protein
MLTRAEDTVESALASVVRMMVEHAGGRYCGIQKPVPEAGINYALVMFNAPCGSTCALKLDESLSTQSIQRKISEKEAEFHV